MRALTQEPAASGAAPPPTALGVRQHAEAVEGLRRLAHTDLPTGLPNRRYFLGRLRSALADPGAQGGALLLLRVTNAEHLAAREGQDAAERRLAVVAELLLAYPRHVQGAFAGRLNHCDFALFLPAPGVAEETAGTLLRALRASPVAEVGGAEVVVGVADGLMSPGPSDALAAADQALARAEAVGPYAIEVHALAEAVEPARGERAWRVRLDEALHEERVVLANFPVVDAAGRLLHLESPLRVQLDLGGPFVEARQWLPMAARARLLHRVDLMALELALLATARDAQPRCVHVSAAALGTPGFVAEVQRRLEAAPEAASHLWLEVADNLAVSRALPRLREAIAAWRPLGVRLGLEHAGASMQGLARLAGLGLSYVKIESRFVRGVAVESAVRDFALALVRLVHGLGALVIAEGVDDPGDWAALQQLGFDAVTGPAVHLP
jgi:EAL domain-containing protein (putative c-di-GMP-specific phosphodiesterase class I)/GGDEF domain-containing protein